MILSGQQVEHHKPLATDRAEPSIGDLFGKLGSDTGTLIRQEVNLATVELSEKVSAAGQHALVIVWGSLFTAVSLMTLTAALVIGLAKIMELWVAALLVGLTLGLIAYGIIHKGMTSFREMNPKPTRTLATLKENKSWVQALVR